jgi:hypothetical protein
VAAGTTPLDVKKFSRRLVGGGVAYAVLALRLSEVCCVAQTRAAELAVGRTTPPAIVPFLSVTFASHVLVVVAFPVSPRGCTTLACQVGAVPTMQSVSYQRQTAFWADR